MSRLVKASFLSLALGFNLWSPLRGADTIPASEAVKAVNSAEAAFPSASAAVKPGPKDGVIAFVTAQLLQQLHYSREPFDDTISSQLLDRYLESLDPRHMHFIQSDLDEFERYRTNLDDLTIAAGPSANVTPAFEILSRFVERLKERTAYASELLQKEEFRYETDERIATVRRTMPYPRDLADARQLWRQWLRYEYLQEKLAREHSDPAEASGSTDPQTVHREIVEKLSHRYRRTVRIFTDWTNEDVLGLYLTTLAHVYDPHSDYFNREALDSFKVSMNLELFGIGAQLRSEDGYCKIQALLPGGPAIKSQKIKEGAYIVAVAQGDQPAVDVVDMSLNKVVQLIRGPKGTEVRLTLVPDMGSSARSVVALIRDRIPLEDSAAKGRIIEIPDVKEKKLRLGVIDLPSFYAPVDTEPVDLAGSGGAPEGQYTSVDVARLLAKFKQENVQGVILDLRRNGGGSLEEAIRLTGLFIKKGPVVQARSFDDSVQVYADMDASVAYDGPLIVMTSRFSASASEIVAGALQDYGRALIVGDTSTHGKGTVQHLQKLRDWMRMAPSDTNEPGALKVTIRKFYRASGASTQLKGVMPDIVLPSQLNHLDDIGESALPNALPWDMIPGARHDKLDLVQPYLSELLNRSSARIATNRDFAYIREDIEEYRKSGSDKTVSLNEAQRLKEKREAESREKERDKERLSRKEPDETVYEITVKQASLPGLPAPVQKTNSAAGSASHVAVTNLTATANQKADSGSLAKPSVQTGNSITNAASQIVTAVPRAADADDDDETKPPPVDPTFEETKRIMLDYLRLFPKESPLLATH
jgi:carboxyl-terminal processing protease